MHLGTEREVIYQYVPVSCESSSRRADVAVDSSTQHVTLACRQTLRCQSRSRPRTLAHAAVIPHSQSNHHYCYIISLLLILLEKTIVNHPSFSSCLYYDAILMRLETRLTTYQVWESPQDHDLGVNVNIIEKEVDVVQHNIVLCCLNFENIHTINTVKSWFYFQLTINSLQPMEWIV